jgi:hypothetical protein
VITGLKPGVNENGVYRGRMQRSASKEQVREEFAKYFSVAGVLGSTLSLTPAFKPVV